MFHAGRGVGNKELAIKIYKIQELFDDLAYYSLHVAYIKKNAVKHRSSEKRIGVALRNCKTE